ncbi:PAS domain-containing sensor histidine kinase [Pseudoalteromonas xiamenensis]
MELNSVKSFFSNAYMPHGHCYLWQEHILWTNVVSDLVIATAYFSIPIAILIFANKRKDVGFHWLFLLFSAFILLCGITHLMGIYTVWNGTYGLQGLSKAATAAVSLITAVYLFRLIPEAIKLPTLIQFEGVQAELVHANKESANLKNQVAEHQLTQFMLNAHPAGTLLIDDSLTIVYCNPAILRELNYPHKRALIGKHLSDFISIDDPDISFGSLGELLEKTTSLTQTALCHVVAAQGTKIPMSMTVVQEKLHDQDMILISFLNLSEQRQIEAQLIDYHKRMERVIDATEDGIWEWYVQENRVVYSNTLMKLIGKAHIEKPQFEDWFSHIHPDYRTEVMNAINQHLASKDKYQIQYLGLDKDGEYSWFSAIGDSQFDDEGNAIVMSGSLRNIQRSKQLELQVKEKTDILNAIYNGSSQAIWLLQVEENDFTFLEFNETASSRSGIAVSNIIGKRLSELAKTVISDELTAQLNGNYRRCVQEAKPIEYVECIPLGNKPRWYQTTLYPLFEKNSITKIVGSAIDISARIEIEEALNQNQQFLEKMINSAVCGLYLFHLGKRKTVRINQRFIDLLGYDLDELQDVETQNDCYHPDDIESMTAHWQAVKQGSEGQLLPIKYRFKHKDGSWVWCYCVNTVVTFKNETTPEIVLGTFVDITEQTLLLNQLQESNAHLEQFAFVASHDLQEPLRKISAFSDSLRSRLKVHAEQDEKIEFELSRLVDSASRMRTMIQDLLKLSRIHSTELTLRPTTLKAIVEDTQDQLSYILHESKAKLFYTGENIELKLDHSLFIQVFQNLIANSIKFRQPDEVPIIKISVTESSYSWKISYQDNGIGIADEFRQQVFEPFRRLNAQSRYPGSGMGLAICKQIIKRHSGTITCSDPIDKIGAQFQIELPKKERSNS